MTLEELRKRIQNTLALPFAWEKVGLGNLPVEPVAAYVRDRAAHLAQDLYLLLAPDAGDEVETVRRALAADAGRGRLRTGEVVGVDDDGPIRASYVSRYPRSMYHESVERNYEDDNACPSEDRMSAADLEKLRLDIARHWGQSRAAEGKPPQDRGDVRTGLGREHRDLYGALSTAIWDDVLDAYAAGHDEELSAYVRPDCPKCPSCGKCCECVCETEDDADERPFSLASLQKLIQNGLAYPFAWEKFGLGDAKVGAVGSYCRDRSAYLAQVIWSKLHDAGIDES